MGKIDRYNCPNLRQHVSAFAAYDRTICPICGQVYIKKEVIKERYKDEKISNKIHQ